jgi:hypothetical protein
VCPHGAALLGDDAGLSEAISNLVLNAADKAKQDEEAAEASRRLESDDTRREGLLPASMDVPAPAAPGSVLTDEMKVVGSYAGVKEQEAANLLEKAFKKAEAEFRRTT